MLNPLDSRPDPRPSPPPARRVPDRARDDAPVFTVRDEPGPAPDARPAGRSAASRPPERDGRVSTDRSATATPTAGPRDEPRTGDTAVAAPEPSEQIADAMTAPLLAAAKPGRATGKPKGSTIGSTTGDAVARTTGDRDVMPVPAAMPVPVATQGPAMAAGSPVPRLPELDPAGLDPAGLDPAGLDPAGRTADLDASAAPRAAHQDTPPAPSPIDLSLQAGAGAPAAAPGESLKVDESREADETPKADGSPKSDEPQKSDEPPKDAAFQLLPQPILQPQPVPVVPVPVPAVAPAGPETGTGTASSPVSGASARSAARPAGRAATGPLPEGNAGPAGEGAPDGDVGAATVGVKPTGAVAISEVVPSRPKGAITSEAGPQVSTASPAGAVDFTAHLAQMADPAAAPLAQTLPGAAAASTPSDGTAPRAAAGVPIGDVPVEIGLRALDGSSRFDIRLSPEDLGRIDVKLDIDGDGRVRAHLVVDRPETLAFLQRDGDSLQRAFEQAGFKPAETGIAFSLRDPGQDAGGGRNGSGENGQRPQPAPWAGQGREAAPDAVPTAWRTLQAGRAGIDLRI